MAEEQTVFEEKNIVDTDIVKCQNCGSNMVFDPDSQCLYCEHCDSKKDLSLPSSSEELNIYDGLSNNARWEHAVSFACDNCGAKVVLPEGQTTHDCPFCGTAHVVKTEELVGLVPNALVPFAFGGDMAVQISKNWAKKKLYAPRSFKKNIKVENLKGVYSPCFTFDSFTTSSYQARLGKTYTRVVGSGKNRRTTTYTVWQNVSGVYTNAFDDVLISAGNKVNQKTIDNLSPYDTGNSRKYQEEYLLGFMAYQHDSQLSTCWNTAKTKMDATIKANILKRYSYDRIDYINVSTTHENVTYKYVMLPVYVANYAYKKKRYNFYVNGYSGKVTGKTPKSVWKILLSVLLGVAVVGGIVALALLL